MGANEKHAATYHGLSDDTVRGRYCDGTHAQTGHTTDGAEYDTWLARVRAEAKAEALREAAAQNPAMLRDMVTRHSVAEWLQAKAPQEEQTMTTPDQKALETVLAKIREAAADNEASPGMSQDYADGYANALDKITEILDSCTTQQDPTPAPLGADQKMKISAVRKAHKIETRRNIFTREEWLNCTCGWTSQKVKPEGTDWETEKLEHTIDALNEK